MIEGKVYVPLSGTFRCSTPKFNPFDTLGSIVDFEGIELFDTGDSLVLLSIDETFGEIEEAFPNAYTTKLYTELDEPGPALTFGYPDSWRIVDREVDEELGREYVRLKNDRDAVVSLEWWLAKPVPMPSMRATMMGRSGDAEVLQDVSFTGGRIRVSTTICSPNWDAMSCREAPSGCCPGPNLWTSRRSP